MNCIHDNEVNNIAECNVLHDILNPTICNKNVYRQHCTILKGCTNTRKGKVRF